MQDKELIKLVSDVFGQEPGKSLLQELEDELSVTIYDDNPNKVYYRIGQMDLVRRLKAMAAQPKELLDFINQRDQNLSDTGEL